jgi:hypothetical protein
MISVKPGASGPLRFLATRDMPVWARSTACISGAGATGDHACLVVDRVICPAWVGEGTHGSAPWPGEGRATCAAGASGVSSGWAVGNQAE